MSKKIFGLVALFAAVVLLGGVNTAKAATAQELQDQINALLAQIGSLQGGTSTSCYSFTRDLTVGSQGADVTALQNYLAAKGYFNVAATGYFGAITAQAAASWQSANGVMPAAGYFGAISRAKYNSMCSSTVPPMDGDDDDDDDDTIGNDGEEASLEDFDSQSGDDTSVEEGQEGAEVLEFEFDVEDSDVEVQRVEVNFNWDGTGSGEEDPWKAFDSATLWLDGEEVGEADLSDEDNWDEEVSNDEWSFRFNGVDTVVSEGETAEFVLALDVASSVDGSSTATNNEWYVSIDNDGVRALDEAGIDQYTGEDGDDVLINIEEAGNENELSVSEADNDPESTVFEGDTSETSDWLTVAVLEVSAEGELQLNDIMFDVAAANGSDTYDGLVNDLQLVIGDEEYSEFSVVNSTGATGTVTFDLEDDDVILEDGEDLEIEVQIELKGSTGNWDEGDNLVVNASSTAVDQWDIEGVDSGEDLAAGQLNGSYSGEVHTARTSGISLGMLESSDEDAAPVGGDEAQANFWIEFEVTAFGEDFYIPRSAASDTTPDGSDGVEYAVENDSGTASTTASVSDALTSPNSEAGDSATAFKVSEGDTRTFKLQVTFDATGTGTAGYYRVQMYGVSFDDDSALGSVSTLSTGLDDFETETSYVSNVDANN